MEYFDVCDEQGSPTGEIVERSHAHREGICHRTAHVWLVRRREGRYQVLLQKRSMEKDSFPGCLDTSSAGHIPAGSAPLQSALRELREELGIEAVEDELTCIGTFRVRYEKVFHGILFKDNETAFVYIFEKDMDAADLVIQKEELESVGWYDLEETYERCKVHDTRYCVPLGGLELVRGYIMTKK